MTRKEALLISRGQILTCVSQKNEWTKDAGISVGDEVTVYDIFHSVKEVDIEENMDISFEFEEYELQFSYVDFVPRKH